MTLKTEVFETASLLADFVNSNNIAQADIQSIWCYDHAWYLLYWSA